MSRPGRSDRLRPLDRCGEGQGGADLRVGRGRSRGRSARSGGRSPSDGRARPTSSRPCSTRSPGAAGIVGAARHHRRRSRVSASPGCVGARPRSTADELVTWRQGRCLPYGEGVTFGRWGRSSRPRPGSSTRTTPSETYAKLDSPSLRRRWTRRSTYGSTGSPRSSSPGGGCLPSRLRRSCSRPGGATSRRWPPSGPSLLVVEDLHWADNALLDFLEDLLDWAVWVPVRSRDRPARALREPSRTGEEDVVTRRRSGSRRSPMTRRERLICRVAGTLGAAGRDTGRAARARRAETRSTRSSSCACWRSEGERISQCRSRSGVDLGAARHIVASAEVAGAGRLRSRQGLLDGCPRGDGRPRPERRAGRRA